MIEETHRLVRALQPERLDALEILRETWRDFGFRSYRTADFPEFDVCAGPLPDRFDVIIAEQVFEHLLWPYRAGRNVFEMLRPGGYFHINTPFLFPVHDAPVDCSRWTELGLKHFLAECGFPLDSIVTGSLGEPRLREALSQVGRAVPPLAAFAQKRSVHADCRLGRRAQAADERHACCVIGVASCWRW